MDIFLNLEPNAKFELINKIIEIHEEAAVEYAKHGVDILLPSIGRLAIKKGKLIYNGVLKDYLEDNHIDNLTSLTEDDRDEITKIMKDRMLQKKLNNKQILNEIRVLTFKPKI